MSVASICNMVLGGLEMSVLNEFYMILQYKADHIDILSSVFEIHFYFSVLFHILYIFNLMLMSAVCK